uniref:Uncharacterized protein n=1 Tax=Oryza brachyantha TaxID=4533 RepID=J3L6L7_ORYBR
MMCLCGIGRPKKQNQYVGPTQSATHTHKNYHGIVCHLLEVNQGPKVRELPQGYLGKMLVYKCCKIKMKLGDAMFDLNLGEECRMPQHVVAINTLEKRCCLLGEIENRHVVVTLNVDWMLSDSRG